MAWIFKDDDYQKLEAIISKLLDAKHQLSQVEQKTLGAALLFVMTTALHVEDVEVGDIKKIKKKVEDGDLEAVMLKVTPRFESLLKSFTNEVGGVIMSNVDGVPWFFPDENAPHECGIVPTFIKLGDERPLTEQINSRYVSGWHSFQGLKLDLQTWALQYPGNPDLHPLGGAALNGEIIVVYPHGWTAIVTADIETEHFEVARLD